MEIGEITLQSEKNQKIEKATKEMVQRFNENGINYFIIGSFARNVYMGKEPKSPELDLLIPNPKEREMASKLIPELQTSNPDIDYDLTLSNLLTENNGEYSLSHGEINYPLNKGILKPVPVKFGEVTFNTLSPETLLHTYSFLGGPFRKKDWKNALIFARWLKKEGYSYEHSDFKAFHKFSKERWNSSPLKKVQYVWRRMLDLLPGDFRNSVLNMYGNPIVKNVREAFNVVEESTCGYKVE